MAAIRMNPGNQKGGTNTKDVVYPRSVAGPGCSAESDHRTRRAQRRRARLTAQMGRVVGSDSDALLRHLRRGRRRLGRAWIGELSAALDAAFPPDNWYDRGRPGGGYEVDMSRSPMRALRFHD